MAFINTSTLRYPMSFADVQAENPQTSFAQPWTPSGNYAAVISTAMPSIDPLTQKIIESVPVLTSGAWYQTWSVQTQTTAEQAATAAAVSAANAMLASVPKVFIAPGGGRWIVGVNDAGNLIRTKIS